MPSRSVRNNNPGNIRHNGKGSFAERTGASGADAGGYAVYPTIAQGTAAAVRLLAGSGFRHLTVLEAIKRWAPAEDNNHPVKYYGFVCAESGVGPDEIIADLDPFVLLDVAKAMFKFEGWEEKETGGGRASSLVEAQENR